MLWILLLALLVGLLIIVMTPPRLWRVGAAIGLFILIVGGAFVGSIDMAGKPKPVSLEWRHVEEADVLGADWIEGEAIFLLLKAEGWPEPIVYQFPWSQDRAQALQEAMAKAKESKGTLKVTMIRPFRTGDEEEDVESIIHPAPVAALEPKGEE